jgi:CPA2 family monovalent cation:H+ antiporter-2
VLRELDSPILVVDLAAPLVEAAESDGLMALFGDASNSDILNHAGLHRANALVVTVPSQTATELIVMAAVDLAPDLPIIARAGTLDGVRRLHDLGARHVINPELEGGLEIVRHTLLELHYPLSRLQSYVDAVRRDAYQGRFGQDDERAEAARALDQLLTAVRGVDVAWHVVPEGSPLAGLTLGATELRSRTGASVVAIMHRGEVAANPSPQATLAVGDLLGLIGTADELAAVEDLLDATTPVP